MIIFEVTSYMTIHLHQENLTIINDVIIVKQLGVQHCSYQIKSDSLGQRKIV